MSDDGVDDLRAGRVLVTGATGFLGGALLERLVSIGVPTRALVRTEARAAPLRTRGVDVVVGDLSNQGAVAAAVDDVAVVFHLAGKLYGPWESPIDYRRTHVDGTKQLIECTRAQQRLRRFVHCSTTGVLGVTGARPVAENSPMQPTNVYEATKAEAELAVLAACTDGLPAVVARPGLVYGPGDLHLVGFFRSVLKRRFRPIGREPVWLHPIYVDDMTDAFMRCAVSPGVVGETFNLAGPEPVSLEQLAAAIAAAGGTKPAAGRIPLPAARALAAIGDALPPSLQSSAPLTKSRLDFLTHSRVYSVAKAAQLLEFVAPTALSDGMARSVAWYRTHGYLPA